MKLAPRIAAALLALGLTAAQAHNVWLLPSATSLSKPEWVTVDAAVANDLFYFPLKLDHLAITAPDGSRVEPDKPFTGNLRSVFDFKPAQRGTYRVAIVNAGGLTAIYKDGEGKPKRWRGTKNLPPKCLPTPKTWKSLNPACAWKPSSPSASPAPSRPAARAWSWRP